MSPTSTLGLVNQLANAATRQDMAATLAGRLGVEAFLLFIRDAQLATLLPAPGFPQTIPGGRSWRDLLARCSVPGYHVGDVVVSFFNAEQTRRAHAWVSVDGTALVLLGGAPIEAEVEVVRGALPLLAAALRCEQIAGAAAGEVEVARNAEHHARALATKLDATRAELARALAEAARLDGKRARIAADLQKKSEEALQLAQEKAKMREEFIAILAHDLRNPLGTIVVTSEWMLGRLGVADERQKHLQRVLRSANRIERMLHDLLDFGRAHLGGGIPITPAPIDDLTSFFGHLVEEIGTTHPGRRIALDIEPGTSVCWDPDRMAQILSNLIGNALTHSPADTDVCVSAHSERDLVLVKIHNRGAPIVPELLGKLFEPFLRGADGNAGVKSGLGLGLFIAEAIVKAHHGAITVISSAAEGTTFSLSLPRRIELRCNTA